MITKTALVGLAHFLMQADPQTAQNIMNQLPADQSQQIVQMLEKNETELPACFEENLRSGSSRSRGPVVASPSHETTTE